MLGRVVQGCWAQWFLGIVLGGLLVLSSVVLGLSSVGVEYWARWSLSAVLTGPSVLGSVFFWPVGRVILGCCVRWSYKKCK